MGFHSSGECGGITEHATYLMLVSRKPCTAIVSPSLTILTELSWSYIACGFTYSMKGINNYWQLVPLTTYYPTVYVYATTLSVMSHWPQAMYWGMYVLRNACTCNNWTVTQCQECCLEKLQMTKLPFCALLSLVAKMHAACSNSPHKFLVIIIVCAHTTRGSITY